MDSQYMVYILSAIFLVCGYFLRHHVLELVNNIITILGFGDNTYIREEYEDEDNYYEEDEVFDNYENNSNKNLYEETYEYEYDETAGDYYKIPVYKRRSNPKRHSYYRDSILKKYVHDYVQDDKNVYEDMYDYRGSSGNSSNKASNKSTKPLKPSFFDMNVADKKYNNNQDLKQESLKNIDNIDNNSINIISSNDIDNSVGIDSVGSANNNNNNNSINSANSYDNDINNTTEIVDKAIYDGYAEYVPPSAPPKNVDMQSQIKYSIDNNLRRKLEDTLNIDTLSQVGNTRPYSMSRQVRNLEESIKHGEKSNIYSDTSSSNPPRSNIAFKKYSKEECMRSFRKSDDNITSTKPNNTTNNINITINNNNPKNNDKLSDLELEVHDLQNMSGFDVNLDIKSNIEQFFNHLLDDILEVEYLNNNLDNSFSELETLESFYNFRENFKKNTCSIEDIKKNITANNSKDINIAISNNMDIDASTTKNITKNINTKTIDVSKVNNLIDLNNNTNIKTNANINTYQFPKLDFLTKTLDYRDDYDYIEIKKISNLLINTLKKFGFNAKIINVKKNIIITRYNLELCEYVENNNINKTSSSSNNNNNNIDILLTKMSSVLNNKDLNISNSPILVKSSSIDNNFFVDISNNKIKNIDLREVLLSKKFYELKAEKYKSKSLIGLGKDMNGEFVIEDISELGNILIAGNSGKSVFLKTLITSILYNDKPEEVKFFIIDFGDKNKNFSNFDNIPHLVTPIIDNEKKALSAINWCIGEMMIRFNLFSENNVTNLEEYNTLINNNIGDNKLNNNKLPKIIIIINEFADLIDSYDNSEKKKNNPNNKNTKEAKEVESAICRLAQLSKSTGIHVIITTSVVNNKSITSLIKTSFSCKICFNVSNEKSSKLVINEKGAEKLLGYGDMFFKKDFSVNAIRVKGTFITDDEVEKITSYIKENNINNINNFNNFNKQEEELINTFNIRNKKI